MIDTHAHIHDKQFDDDRSEVVKRAKAAGVSAIVTVGCDLADTERALAAAREFDCYASVGIHPHEAEDAPADIAAAFARFADDPKIIAVGETGLDYYYEHSPRDAQQRAMREQIRFAGERELPVIFHHRDAFDDFVSILREEWKPGMRGVIHCFTGDTTQATTYVEEFGLYLGIGGAVTFKTAERIREAVRTVGVAPLVLETDCPYLAPVPNRGKRNEPAFIAATAAKIAELLRISADDVVFQTTVSANKLFNLK